MKASFKGYVDAARLLLEHGANPNLSDHNRVAALLVATERNNTELVHLLLEKGANPDSVQLVQYHQNL
jgi:ankyrin repeat protein